MKRLFILLLIPITLLSAFATNAQEEKSRRERKADKLFFARNYDRAIDHYTRTKELTWAGQRNLAESYYKTGEYLKAEETYAELIFATQGAVAEDYFHYAMALKANGKYAESMIAMDNFAQLKPGDMRARSYLENRGELAQLEMEHSMYQIQYPEMNDDNEDFGANHYEDSMVFASSRAQAKMIKRLDNHTGKPYYNIYTARVSNDGMEDPAMFDRSLNEKYHEGPASFSNGRTYMAYTKNHSKDKSKDKIVELQIWFRDWDFAENEWGEERPFIYNSENYSVGHPFLLEDGQTMYFTSNMAGGYGGTDLYMTTKDTNDQWTQPVNLGAGINTEGDEMFPFFDEQNEILFFASNGHFGLGGLDIFMTPANRGQFGAVYNPGAPVNTGLDDFNMVMNEDLRSGYFSSNRSRNGDDIYAFNVTDNLAIGHKIVGTVSDEDEKPLEETFVVLLDDQGTLLQSMITEEDGEYSFLVESDRYYRVVATKTNYEEGNAYPNTFGDEFIVRADITLKVKPEEEVVEADTAVTDGEINVDFGNVMYFNPIYFDFDRYDIRPDAMAELNKIVKVMNENPNLELHLTSHADSRGTNTYNQELSEKRAQASVSYIRARITNPERITAEGYGETMLVNGCVDNATRVVFCDETDHEKNRRTEFVAVTKQ